MPVTTAALAMNIAVGFAAWRSPLPVSIKIIITAVLIGKYALFFYSVWLSEEEWMRKLGVTVCIALNTAIIIYAFRKHELLMAISTGILLLFLLVWAIAVVYDFAPKTKQE